MTKRLFPILIVLVAAALSPLGAQSSLSGDLTGSLGIEPVEDAPLALDFRLRGRFEVWKGELGLVAEATLLAPELLEDGSGLSGLRWLPGELYGDLATPAGAFRFGWQVNRWGNSLAMPVIDILNPVDYREQFTGSGWEYWIPVPALRWRYEAGALLFEALWALQFVPAEIPDDGAALIPAGILYGGRELPEASLSDTEYGGRIRWFSPVGDFGLSVWYGFDDLPVTETNIEIVEGAPAPVIRASYERFLMTGLDAAVPVGEFLFRAEAAGFWGKYYSREGLALEPVSAEELAGQLGIEWMPGDFRLVAEATGRWIPRHEKDFVEDSWGLTLAGEAAWSFADDRCELSLAGFYETADGEWYVNPEFSAVPADGVTVRLGAHILGKNGGMLELYDFDRTIYLEAVYAF